MFARKTVFFTALTLGNTMIRVVMFEDNKNFRESLSLYLSASEDIWFSGAFPDARMALWAVKKHKPDVVLMDIQMPHISGIEAMAEIRQFYPDVKVIIQTVFEDDERIFQAICAGASGYIVKSPNAAQYVQAIKEVYAGGSHLSPTIAARVLGMFQNKFVQNEPTFIDLTQREKDVLACMVKGMSYKMIADACDMKYSTVNTHIKHIYEKLHVNSAPEAVARALAMGLG